MATQKHTKMKEVKHREIDRYSTSKEEHALIKEFMEDKRKDIDYYQWSELINVMEVIENSLPVQIEMTSNCWYIKHQYQKFHQTFMWHNYRTRQTSLFVIIVEFLCWWNKGEWKIIDAHYEWLDKQTKSD